MRSVILALLLALIGLQYKLWLSDGSVAQWISLKQRIEGQAQKNEALLNRNRAMQADILELKNGDQALEEEARHALGMIKKDEVYYQFLD